MSNDPHKRKVARAHAEEALRLLTRSTQSWPDTYSAAYNVIHAYSALFPFVKCEVPTYFPTETRSMMFVPLTTPRVLHNTLFNNHTKAMLRHVVQQCAERLLWQFTNPQLHPVK